MNFASFYTMYAHEELDVSDAQKQSLSLHLMFIVLIAMFLLGSLSPARAAEKTFSVLPFTIHGPDKYRYLQQGIPSMLTSRLTWEGRYEPAQKTASFDVPENKAGAQKVKEAAGVDFLVWGDVTVMGDEASLDVTVLDEKGELHAKNRQTALNELIPALEEVSAEINAQVFERKPQKVEEQPKPQKKTINPELVYNRDGTRQSATEEVPRALNPEFRYQSRSSGSDSGTWRSQSMIFAALGMVVGDADGNGTQEIFMLEDHAVRAFRYRQNKLAPLAVHQLSTRIQCLNINFLDINGDGYGEIIVSAYRDDPNDLHSFILNFQDGSFQVVHEGIDLFLGVARTPPTYSRRLIGQKSGLGNDLFSRGVHEVVKSSGSYSLGPSLPLPPPATVFNFAFLPEEDGDDKVVMVNADNLFLYDRSGEVLGKAKGPYAAKDIGLEIDQRTAGMGESESNRYSAKYYVPARIVPTDLRAGERPEFLVSRSYSATARVLRNYRAFVYSEIHSMFWDKAGLHLHWKTRQMTGNLADYGVADIDNDGSPELYACVVSNRGATGLRQRKTFVMGYELDLSQGAEEEVK